jgi:hypothetical protein
MLKKHLVSLESNLFLEPITNKSLETFGFSAQDHHGPEEPVRHQEGALYEG